MPDGYLIISAVCIVSTFFIGFCLGHKLGYEDGDLYGQRKLFRRLVYNGINKRNLARLIEETIPSANTEKSLFVADKISGIVVNSAISLLNEEK